MASFKLAPAPVFEIDRYGEVVKRDHDGPTHIVNCKSRIMEVAPDVVSATRLVDIVNSIAHIENVENVYILSVVTTFNDIKIRYGVHPDF